jgi:putative sterol carrier protein
MTLKAFSPEFANAYKDEINRSQTYKQAGKGWKWSVGLVVEAEPDKNVPEDQGLFLDLYEGEARDVRSVGPDEAKRADFVISGSYSRWKQVMKKELDPTRAMLQGKLKVKGDLPTIVRYTKASQEMAECTSRIDVEFPDEVTA